MQSNQNRRTWGWIWAMTLLSVGITMTTMFTLRAFAQQPAPTTTTPATTDAPAASAPAAGTTDTAPGSTSTPAADEAGADGDALPDDQARRPAPAPILPPDPPELRESADNNISFPVDI
jgi:hypothetical protein